MYLIPITVYLVAHAPFLRASPLASSCLSPRIQSARVIPCNGRVTRARRCTCACYCASESVDAGMASKTAHPFSRQVAGQTQRASSPPAASQDNGGSRRRVARRQRWRRRQRNHYFRKQFALMLNSCRTGYKGPNAPRTDSSLIIRRS